MNQKRTTRLAVYLFLLLRVPLLRRGIVFINNRYLYWKTSYENANCSLCGNISKKNYARRGMGGKNLNARQMLRNMKSELEIYQLSVRLAALFLINGKDHQLRRKRDIEIVLRKTEL